MTTFTPRRIVAKASKAGKTFWEIETDQGNATCFDYPIVQELEKSLGKPISLYDLESNEKGFVNIRPTRHAKQEAQVQAQAQAKQPDAFVEARNAKDVSMFTSYAKDIFIELAKMELDETFEDRMKRAIALVKQAKGAFEK